MELPKKLTDEQRGNIKYFIKLYNDAISCLSIVNNPVKPASEELNNTKQGFKKFEILARESYLKAINMVKELYANMDETEQDISVAYIMCKYKELRINELLGIYTNKNKCEFVESFFRDVGIKSAISSIKATKYQRKG